jgi:hypothetical protein
MDKDLKKLIKACEEQGFPVRYRASALTTNVHRVGDTPGRVRW